MQNSNEFIDHEVRIRSIESKYDEIKETFKKIDEKFNKVDAKFDKLDAKMDSQFHWVLGTILVQIGLIVSIFGGIILHMAKLI